MNHKFLPPLTFDYREMFQNTQPLLHRDETFTSSITPLCIPFPIVAQYPGWKQHGREVYDRIHEASIEDGSLRNPISSGATTTTTTTTVNRADGGRKVLEQSIGDTRRSRQFIPLEFCQDPSVRRIGCNEKCQTRDRESLRCLWRSGGWIVIAISFRAIERNVDSLQIGKYYCY